ncbi:Bifunctional epoxide hydrolase 2 [Hondaea fermentalgiana]|uniref:Bifunctional epoxide hydrolase 2 n=1 Tax=Hondaea fermentalgiana TaxID=2315210 RepID=A0A2R5FYQ9_9STRA|nr:Bifunctional epoxide hydrolase 2 [Hondaea fermentalgiana]|eukprot:GBG23887.1 Bifunctional epoxide hydrolase 2 [Hondaea fermentalgiana]
MCTKVTAPPFFVFRLAVRWHGGLATKCHHHHASFRRRCGAWSKAEADGKQTANWMTMVSNANRGVVALVASFVLLLVSVLAFAEVFYSYGTAVWALYGSVAGLNVGLAFRRDLAPNKLHGALLGFAGVMSFAGFVAAAYWALLPDVEQGAPLKIVAVAAAHVLLVYWTALKFTGAENAEDRSIVPRDVETSKFGGDESSIKQKAGACCGCCGILTLVILVALASIHTILLASEKKGFYPGEDTFYEIQGHRIFARCEGPGIPGEPSIFFGHGLGGNSLDFSWVQRNLSAAGYRTCSYDRAGTGQSSAFGPLPRTSIQIASEEYDLLTELGISDFVYVGHSFFGFNSRVLHRDLVRMGEETRIKGIVYIDQVNPNVTEWCDPNKEYSSPAVYNLGLITSEMGVSRILEGIFGFLTSFGELEYLPEDVQAEYVANLHKSHYYRTRIDEFTRWGVSCSTVGNLEGEEKNFDFPERIVLPQEGIHADNLEGGAEMVDLSPDGQVIWVNDTRATHVRTLFDREFAQYTIDAIYELLALL